MEEAITLLAASALRVASGRSSEVFTPHLQLFLLTAFTYDRLISP
jgi:hypothetical protein